MKSGFRLNFYLRTVTICLTIQLCFYAEIFGQIESKTVTFPAISEAQLLVDNGKEHFFASYYGINSFSANDRYATILETDIKHRLPTENDPALLAMVDLHTGALIPLAETRAWNFQQGCMAHWLGTSPDSLIIYNDLRDGQFISIVLNVHTKEEIRTYPYPVSAVSLDGKWAASINFARLRQTRSDYGYGGDGQKAQMDIPFPNNDGLFVLNLETGEAELIVSLADIQSIVPSLPPEGREYFNHTLFSRDGKKIFWLARAIPERNTMSLVVDRSGKNLIRCFPDGWGGSHYDWLNGEELMVSSAYQGKQYSHVLFTPGKDNYRRLGNGLLDYDGHGTFSPDGKWMITDTYPHGSKLREQKIYLMDMETQAVLPIDKFVEPEEFKGHWRCDIHPRWSSSGRLLGFNSTHTGSRQAYIYRMKY